MRVNRRRRRLQPDAWRTARLPDRLTNCFSGIHARPDNFASVLRGITTVHALAGEINHDISALKFRAPISACPRIPKHDPSHLMRVMLAAQDHDVVPVLLKSASEQLTYLPGTTRDHSFHLAWFTQRETWSRFSLSNSQTRRAHGSSAGWASRCDHARYSRNA